MVPQGFRNFFLSSSESTRVNFKFSGVLIIIQVVLNVIRIENTDGFRYIFRSNGFINFLNTFCYIPEFSKMLC